MKIKKHSLEVGLATKEMALVLRFYEYKRVILFFKTSRNTSVYSLICKTRNSLQEAPNITFRVNVLMKKLFKCHKSYLIDFLCL